MPISPRRRRRTLREHQPRQNGNTLEYSADKLKVSVATVHDDPRLLETNWDDFDRATRHDLLLQQITRVNCRISQLLNWKPPGPEAGGSDPGANGLASPSSAAYWVPSTRDRRSTVVG